MSGLLDRWPRSNFELSEKEQMKEIKKIVGPNKIHLQNCSVTDHPKKLSCSINLDVERDIFFYP